MLAGRAAATLSRTLGRGGGTVLPGHIVPRIDPDALQAIVGRLPHGAVLVSGTNGKTTTTRIVAHIARAAGLRPIHNRSGANLMTGIVAAVAARSDLSGAPRGDIGIFEVDEATLPQAVDAIRPRVVALLDVFRDQLDRYGEVEAVAESWRQAVARLAPEATLVINVDDPIVAQVAEAALCGVVGYGVEDTSVGSPALSHEADKRLCHHCGARLAYSWAYYGHIGHYRCTACGWQRPRPEVAAAQVRLGGTTRTHLRIIAGGRETSSTLGLPGLYNAYNALAAAAVSQALDIASSHVRSALESFTAVFGRQETIAVGAGEMVLALVKNPVGFNQVLQALLSSEFRAPSPGSGPDSEPGTRNPELVVIAINDLFADGTDVSWLWDVDFERLADGDSPLQRLGEPAPAASPGLASLRIPSSLGHPNGSSASLARRMAAAPGRRMLCTGLRAHDMALRLKYALVPEDAIDVEPKLERAVESALQSAASGSRVLVFPTYSAMLAIRGALQRRGYLAPFWED